MKLYEPNKTALTSTDALRQPKSHKIRCNNHHYLWILSNPHKVTVLAATATVAKMRPSQTEYYNVSNVRRLIRHTKQQILSNVIGMQEG
jgi:hypothetical protein